MKTFDQFLEIINTLRGPNGCAWDRKQTHKSLIPYLLEESYEVMDALLSENEEELKEELGDLLLQIVLHAQIAKEKNQFSMQEVIQGISEKLIRRHPHVFGNIETQDVQVIKKNWEEIKKKEKQHLPAKKSILEGVPKSMPALLRAYEVQKKAGKAGFQWADHKGALKKLQEEYKELEEAVKREDYENIEEELGDVLFCLVNLGRYFKINPELSLVKVIKKFYKRFSYIEDRVKEQDKDLNDLSLQEMIELWEKSKGSR